MLLAWPFVPFVLGLLLFGPYLVVDSGTGPPEWSFLVVRLAVPWFLAGMLISAGVLLRRPPDPLTRRAVAGPAVSIGLNAAWVGLCWVASYGLGWPVGF